MKEHLRDCLSRYIQLYQAQSVTMHYLEVQADGAALGLLELANQHGLITHGPPANIDTELIALCQSLNNRERLLFVLGQSARLLYCSEGSEACLTTFWLGWVARFLRALRYVAVLRTYLVGWVRW